MANQISSKVPQIRFKGHSGPWRTETVSSLLTERNVQAPKSELYPLMAFIAGEGVAPKGSRYNREFLVNDEFNKNYKQTELGDFIYSSNNLETGSIGTNKYGRASISPVYSIFKQTSEGDSSFIGQLLCKKKFINEMVKWRQGVVYGQWRIHESDFLKINVTFPSVTEQAHIGSYFRELDSLIGLHQGKHDKLLALKKAMLQKMFPQPGTAIPEIRFKGFSDLWESIEMDKLGQPYSGLFGKTKKDFGIGDGRFVTYMGVFSNVVSDLTMTEPIEIDTHQNEVRKGDVFFTISSETPNEVGMSSVWSDETNNVYLNSFCFGFRPLPNLHSDFLAYVLRADAFRKRICVLAQGISRYNISKAKVMKIPVSIPPDPEEQQKIGTYFRTLDELISKHAIQLQKLKQIKSSFLEKMFV